MRCVADTNILLAVSLDEPEKPWLVQVTRKAELAAPSVLPYELANALSALVKRDRIAAAQAGEIWDVTQGIRIRLVDVDIRAALSLAVQHGIYAYDGYFLQCAIELRCPLLTLDCNLRRTAAAMKWARPWSGAGAGG